MNNGVVVTDDMRIFHCADCPYRDRVTGFCGICMRKVMDDMAMIKANRLPINASPSGKKKERGHYDGLV